MESFYGGRPGYGFILRGPSNGGSFTSLNSIKSAITDNKLFFGDYAIIGGEQSQVQGFGNLYRVNEKKQLDFIGNITAPVLKLDFEISDSLSSPTTNTFDSNISLNKFTVYSKVENEKLYLSFGIPAVNISCEMNLDEDNEYSLQVENNAEKPFGPKLILNHPKIVDIVQKSNTNLAEGDLWIEWEEI